MGHLFFRQTHLLPSAASFQSMSVCLLIPTGRDRTLWGRGCVILFWDKRVSQLTITDTDYPWDSSLKRYSVLEGIRRARDLFHSILRQGSHTRKTYFTFCMSLKLGILTKPSSPFGSNHPASPVALPCFTSAQLASQLCVTCTHLCLLPLDHKLLEQGLDRLRYFHSQYLAWHTLLWTAGI